jgi:multidrug efflux system outer membrane protein
MREKAMRKKTRFAAVLLATSLLGGCSLAPDFKLPSMTLPGAYKEQAAQPDAQDKRWKPAESLEKADRGAWWKVFADPQLDALEAQALEANQTLKAAAARVEQSRATVRANASSLLPNIDLGGNAVRSQPAAAGLQAFGGGAPGVQLKPYTLYSASGTASYEADLFGRVRDTERAFRSDADAQEAVYRSMLLALQADVAQTYFSLRTIY